MQQPGRRDVYLDRMVQSSVEIVVEMIVEMIVEMPLRAETHSTERASARRARLAFRGAKPAPQEGRAA